MAGKKFLRYVNGLMTEILGVQTSAGAANAGDVPALDASGRIDNSMVDPALVATPAAVAQEVIDRTAADGVLQGSINAEGVTRAAADTNLQLQITNLNAANITESKLTKDVSASGVIALSAPEQANSMFTFTGLLTGNTEIVIDATAKRFQVDNLTTGAFTLAMRTAGQVGGVVIPQGKTMAMYSNGVDVEDANSSKAPYTVEAGLAQEVIDRTTADGVLQGNINSEAGARAAADALLIPLTQKGATNGVAALDAGGLIPAIQLPPLAITETFVVTSQAEMLALVCNRGDVAVRNDISKSLILQAEPAATLGNWVELLTPVYGTLAQQNANAVTITGGSLAGVSVDGASAVEVGYLSGVTSSIQTQLNSESAARAAHVADTVDAHMATAIGVTPTGNLASTTAQAALVELQGDIDAHAIAADPHPQYTTPAEAAAAAPVQTVHGRAGTVVSSNGDYDLEQVYYPAALKIGAPTHIVSAQDMMDHSVSAGIVDGCALTDNGNGTISIAAGNALLRATADQHGSMHNVQVAAQANIAITDGAVNYVYYSYNGGSPTFMVSTSITAFTGMETVLAWVVHRDGNLLHYIDARNSSVDNARKTTHMFLDYARFIHAAGGTAIGSPSGLTVSVTEGHFYFMLTELAHTAFDTSVAGTANDNVFTLWYRNGAGGWTQTANQKTVTASTYDNNTGTPVAMSNNNKYGVTWFYVVNDNPSELHAVMGQQEYASQADAEAATPPSSIPSLLSGMSVLIGFVVYNKIGTAFANIKSAFSTTFGSSAAVSHNSIAGLQGGSVGEYYHLTSAEYTGTGTGNLVRLNSPTLTGTTQVAALTASGLATLNGGISTTDITSTGNTTLGNAPTDSVRINGYAGIGGAGDASVGLYITSTALTSTGPTGQMVEITVPSTATAAATANLAKVSTAAAAFTLDNLYAFRALNATKGAGSTITTQHGLSIPDLTSGTNNYAVTLAVSSGANKRNLNITGTADNVLAGNTRIGGTTAPTVALDVTGTQAVTKATAGDVITFTNAAASNKTGYLYSSASFVALNDAAALAGSGITIDSVSNLVYTRIAAGNVTRTTASSFDVTGAISATTTVTATGNLVTSGGDVVISTAGKGITFSTSASSGTGTVTSNTLKDYEEGTFTPTISGSGTAGAGTYTVQAGRYTKVGNLVHVDISISLASHTGAGDMLVTSLPFALSATTNFSPGITIGYLGGVTLSAAGVATARITPGATYVTLEQYPSGGGSVSAVALDTSCVIRISGTYTV